jgi:hypothetical protein
VLTRFVVAMAMGVSKRAAIRGCFMLERLAEKGI